ncbi:MAG TPA: SDR family NAD(P)-dependent oxidoreductase, partial [Emcibacteraceae bacterium]|nr:SDR family NAD(P)-dependent oxidoreductase [Emcibacteraceae bacterium]
MTDFSLKDKVIVVTGGTGILGKSFIDAIVEAGGSVGILGRNEDIARQRADHINRSGGRAVPLIADVLDIEDLKAAKDKILNKFGRIDGLVNAAGGIMPQGVLMPDQDLFQMDLNGMREVMDLNLWGTLNPTQIF